MKKRLRLSYRLEIHYLNLPVGIPSLTKKRLRLNVAAGVFGVENKWESLR